MNACRPLPLQSGTGCTHRLEPARRRPNRSIRRAYRGGDGGSAGRCSSVPCCSSLSPVSPSVSPARATPRGKKRRSPPSDPCAIRARQTPRARRPRPSRSATRRRLRDRILPHREPNSQAPARASEKKKTPSKKQTPTRPSPPARRAPTGFVPARTWSWEPQSRARRYVFTLARNGRRVIAARTAKPRFVLPQRFQFAAGRYRWRVVALTTKPGARRKVVVDSKFRLSAAGAAAANG